MCVVCVSFDVLLFNVCVVLMLCTYCTLSMCLCPCRIGCMSGISICCALFVVELLFRVCVVVVMNCVC